MKIEKIIFNKFKRDIIVYNGHNEDEMLFAKSGALKVIDELENLHTVILGLDFWKQCEDGRYMEINSTAWDNINHGPNASRKTVEAARELISEGLLDNADCVSFVLKDQSIHWWRKIFKSWN